MAGCTCWSIIILPSSALYLAPAKSYRHIHQRYHKETVYRREAVLQSCQDAVQTYVTTFILSTSWWHHSKEDSSISHQYTNKKACLYRDCHNYLMEAYSLGCQQALHEMITRDVLLKNQLVEIVWQRLCGTILYSTWNVTVDQTCLLYHLLQRTLL